MPYPYIVYILGDSLSHTEKRNNDNNALLAKT